MTNDETTISNTITKKIYRQLFSSYSLIALLVIAISIFYFTFTSNDRVAGIFSDDAMYLLQAELYSPWKSEESPVLDLVRKVSRFPPLYPIVLGLMGVDSHHTVLAAQISCGILLLSIMIFGIWTWHESDQLNLTITILILLALLPSTLIMSQGLWSEFLFMCFIYSAFLCSDSKIKPGQKWLATALLIALSTLTRSIGIAIATAFILLLLLKRTKNRLVYIVSVLSPFLLWTFSRNIVQNHPSYFDDLLTISAGFSLAHIFEVMATRLATLVDSWSWLFSIVESYGIYRYLTVFVAMILFVFAVLGFFMRIKQLKLDALSIPFYLAVILIWPYQNVFFVSRFLYPLLPLFLFYMWIGIQSLPTNKKMHNLIITLWVLSIISIAYPSSRQFIDRGYKEIPSELMPYRRSRNWLLPTTNEIALKQVSFNKTIIENAS